MSWFFLQVLEKQPSGFRCCFEEELASPEVKAAVRLTLTGKRLMGGTGLLPHGSDLVGLTVQPELHLEGSLVLSCT